MTEEQELPVIGQDMRTFYEKWREKEGLDIIEGMFIQDMKTVPLKPWKRKGGNGVFVNLEGAGEENSAYICEIPAGGTLLPQRHMFEESIFILEGRGATTVWNDGGEKQTFEWEPNSLFAIPLNAWHQHFNTRGDKPARYVAVTLAIPMLNLFYSEDFVFNNPFQFKDRFAGNENYFSGDGKLFQQFDSRMKVWETNFVPNVLRRDLIGWKERGGGGRSMMFQLAESCMPAHISTFDVGAYKKGHRHGPGAHVIIVGGEGYSLLWMEGQPKVRYDWQTGSMVVPPDMCWHQHFNLGNEPASYIALHGKYSPKYRTSKGASYFGIDRDVKSGGHQIEYQDEDPLVWEMFDKELAKRGIKNQMVPKVGRI